MEESESFAQGGGGGQIGVFSYFSHEYAGWVVSKQATKYAALIIAGPFTSKTEADAWARHEVSGRHDGHRFVQLQGA